MKNARIVSWLLVSTLTVGVGCGDDDKNTHVTVDSAVDPAVTADEDAGETEADASEEDEVDAAVEGTTDEVDAAVEADSAVEADAAIEADSAIEADASTDAAAPIADLEISGRWHATAGGYSGTEVIAPDSYYGAPLVEVDNTANYAISLNATDAKYNPGKYVTTVWTEMTDGSFYVCSIKLDSDTLAEARAAVPLADTTQFDTTGCAGFSWTKESPVLEIEGAWMDNYSNTYAIDSDKWASTYAGTTYTDTVVEYDNAANAAYTLSPGPTAGTGTYSKLVWTEIAQNAFYYCTIDYGLDTLAKAKATTKVADPSNPDAGGCGMFPWSKLTLTSAAGN